MKMGRVEVQYDKSILAYINRGSISEDINGVLQRVQQETDRNEGGGINKINGCCDSDSDD